FRLPIVAVLIPWAGVGISQFSDLRASILTLRRPIQIASALATIAILVVIVPALPATDTWLGIERWGQQVPYRTAEALLREGKPNEALTEYQRANIDLSDTRYGMAAALIQLGKSDEALAQLRTTDDPDRPEPYIIRGEAARKAGNLDAARSSFNARPVQVAGETALDWAWDHLNPPQTTQIELGSGLDLGYIRGFYLPEKDKDGTTFRWTTDNPEIRWSASPSNVLFTWNAWRTVGSAKVVVDFVPSSTGTHGLIVSFMKTLSNVDNWISDSLATLSTASQHTIEYGNCPIYSCFSMSLNGFVNGGDDPRLLGIRVSSIGIAK
ncbi:MAG: hypothetical protein ABIQ44_01315, partial [Chloroflexia bacterium]